MVVLVHHQAYWSNLPNEDAMVLQDGSTNTKHAKTDLIGCIGDGCSHADAFLPSCVVLMDTNAARDCDLRLLRSISESVEEINLGEFFPFNLRLRRPPLFGVYDFTTGLPPSPPTNVPAYTVGWSHHR
ncbi:Os07g0264450 [Oryza sativa Japonica Group]|uniref:Os07g0264450 protein n=1 Tax=Oryza sativa subsp. japonica TaxID=39947 RepID=A0A0P0X4G7_ORYSJ|nr:Os07g0264450 [Oryza sativa Japonica Group]